MGIVQILPEIYMTKDHSNSFIVDFKDYYVLIDAGMDKKAKEILELLERLGKKPKAILITHGHLDHTNGLAKIKEKYPDLIVASSKEDINSVEGTDIIFPKGFKGFFFKIMMPLMGYKGVKVDEILEDSKTFENFEIIETSGHTKGSLSFLLKIGGKTALFCGDLILNEKNKLSLASDEFNFDKNKILESLKKISEIKFDYLLSGHGEAIKENVNEKIKEFLSKIT